jgi:hypothetical protein
MRKLIVASAGALALGVGGVAVAAPIQTITDPTANPAFAGTPLANTFSGSYTYTYSCPTATDPSATCTGTGTQTGYVAVYDDGIEACNGNPAYTNPTDGSALQGYVWVGPNHQAADTSGGGDAPGGVAGAGHGATNADGSYQQGSSPCPANAG